MVNSESNILDEFSSTGLISFRSFFDCLEKKFDEALQRVLIHMIDDAERDAKEIEHSALSGDGTIDLSLSVDIDFSCLSDLRLLPDRNGSCLGLLEIVDQLFVVEDSCWVSF